MISAIITYDLGYYYMRTGYDDMCFGYDYKCVGYYYISSRRIHLEGWAV